jgi:hypothetical protein
MTRQENHGSADVFAEETEAEHEQEMVVVPPARRRIISSRPLQRTFEAMRKAVMMGDNYERVGSLEESVATSAEASELQEEHTVSIDDAIGTSNRNAFPCRHLLAC